MALLLSAHYDIIVEKMLFRLYLGIYAIKMNDYKSTIKIDIFET